MLTTTTIACLVNLGILTGWTIYTGIIAAGLVIFGKISKLEEKAQIHAPTKWIHKLAGCDFCKGFWISLAMTIAFFLTQDTTTWIFLAPFGAAAITRVIT